MKCQKNVVSHVGTMSIDYQNVQMYILLNLKHIEIYQKKF